MTLKIVGLSNCVGFSGDLCKNGLVISAGFVNGSCPCVWIHKTGSGLHPVFFRKNIGYCICLLYLECGTDIFWSFQPHPAIVSNTVVKLLMTM